MIIEQEYIGALSALCGTGFNGGFLRVRAVDETLLLEWELLTPAFSDPDPETGVVTLLIDGMDDAEGQAEGTAHHAQMCNSTGAVSGTSPCQDAGHPVEGAEVTLETLAITEATICQPPTLTLVQRAA